MDRRAFLVGSACGVGAAAIAAPACSLAAAQATQVLQLDPQAGLWRPFLALSAPAGEAHALRLGLLGPQLVEGTRLRSLELDLLFDTFAPTPARHRAWRFDAGRVDGNSAGCSLHLPEGGVVLEFRLAGHADPKPDYLRVQAAHWPEGDYLVRLDSAPCMALPCGPEGDRAAPVGIDAFLLQVRAEPEAPDLCLRADLACQAQDPAVV